MGEGGYALYRTLSAASVPGAEMQPMPVFLEFVYYESKVVK